MRKTVIILFVLLIASSISAQIVKTEKKKSTQISKNGVELKFTEFKILDDKYQVVYFCIDGINNETQEDDIVNKLLQREDVKKARIYIDLQGHKRCQLTVKQTTTANDIKTVLEQFNTDYKYIFVKGEKTIKSTIK